MSPPPPIKDRLLALAARVAPHEVSRQTFWIEILAIPLAAIAFAWLLRPADPTLIQASFPWLWFAPVLIALRYGVMPGLLASVPLLANWFVAASFLGDGGAFPQGVFFGGILLVLLCGEFGDVWRDRNTRLEETKIYMAERVSRLTRRHLLLNLSHDRLEQEMLTRPGSVRDALVQLRNGVLNNREEDALPVAAELLQILAQYTNVQAASLHRLDRLDDEHIGPPVVTLGDPAPLADEDELLRMALDTGHLAHVADFATTSPHASNQLVVVPVMASDEQPVAVLAISKLPFFSLNVENLQLISIILGYYADSVHSAPALAEVRSRMPSIPAMYADELVRMMALQKRFGIDSQVVVMVFRDARGDEIAEQFLRIKRGLDLYWQTHVNGAPVIAVLMPFASTAGKEGFLQRIGGWLRQRFGGDFEALNITLHIIDFARHDPVTALQKHMVE